TKAGTLFSVLGHIKLHFDAYHVKGENKKRRRNSIPRLMCADLRQSLIYLLFTCVTLNLILPPGVWTLISSLVLRPIRALPRGDSLLILPLMGSASAEPTMR